MDKRYMLMKKRFEFLNKVQLLRIKQNIDIVLTDSCNYNEGKFCPMAIAFNIHYMSDPTDKKVYDLLSTFLEPVNILKGIDGDFYHGDDQQRKNDLLKLINELL